MAPGQITPAPRGNNVGPTRKSRVTTGKSHGPPGEITWAPRGNHVGPHWKSRGPPREITWASRANHVVTLWLFSRGQSLGHPVATAPCCNHGGPCGNHLGYLGQSRGLLGAITWPPGAITWAPRGNHLVPMGQSHGPLVANLVGPLGQSPGPLWALSTGKVRRTPSSCHHSKSPRDISVHSRRTCFPCTDSTFTPRIDSPRWHVGQPCGKPSWESLVGNPRFKAADPLIHETGSVTLVIQLGRKAHMYAPTIDED